MKDRCYTCEAMGPGPHYRDNPARERCRVCNEVKDRVLNLHHTGAVLCSLECEQTYWLDIVL